MKSKYFSFLLIVMLLFSSCSKDESLNEIIIGKWQAISMYQSDVQVEMPICLPYIYSEYRADNAVDGGKINGDDFPDECSSIEFEFGWKWSNLGDNKYRINRRQEPGQIFTIYKDGLNLVIEDPDGITKAIYKPY